MKQEILKKVREAEPGPSGDERRGYVPFPEARGERERGDRRRRRLPAGPGAACKNGKNR